MEADFLHLRGRKQNQGFIYVSETNYFISQISLVLKALHCKTTDLGRLVQKQYHYLFIKYYGI